jgi:Cu/Ag efflux protein CusF
MTELIKSDEEGSGWYPSSIGRLEGLLENAIYTGRGYQHSYALRKNLAYNLQYIQFQDRILQDIKLSSVLYTQTVKTMVLVGCGVIESILHFMLIVNDVHSTTEWKEKAKFKGSQKKIDGAHVKIDTIMYEKLANPELKHMTFDAMIKSAKANNIFGTGPAIYQKLDGLRTLRNKVHLQVINEPRDTDWNSFNSVHLSDICKVLHAVMTSSIFSPTTDQKAYFVYLRRNFIA